MTRPRALLIAALVSLAAAAGEAVAQTPPELLSQGIRAYRDLDYETATRLLRGALGAVRPEPLADSARARALVYLAATELFEGRRDSAEAAFRRLVRLDPRYQPDQLIFPPEVTGLHQQVRLATKTVAMTVPAETRLGSGGERLVVRLFASSYHDVVVSLVRADGVPLRTLYTGVIGDSLDVLWDGRDAAGDMAPAGRMQLVAASRLPGGRVAHERRVPILVERVVRDTLPLPPPPDDSLMRPERSRPRFEWRPLASGLLVAGAAAVLPTLVGASDDASAARFAVAGAAGLSGVVGVVISFGGRPVPANIAANQALREDWRRQVELARADNEQRRRDVRLVIRTVGPQTLEIMQP